jgi:non-ribosomal peptide synthetase component E (peptide arylation enzyme)
MKPVRYTDELVAEYTEKGYWDTATFAEIWERNAKQYPQKEAIVDSGTRLTWAEAKQQIDRIALGLMELIERDKALVVQLPNCAELMLLYVACQEAGIINAGALRTLRHKDMEHVLASVDAEGVVIPWKFHDFDHFAMIQEIKPNLPHLKHIIVVGEEVPPGAISLDEMRRQPLEEKYPPQRLRERAFEATEITGIRHTSGTTGVPKIVEQVICVRMLLAKELVRTFKLTSDDVVAAVTPLAAGPAQIALIAAPLVGAKSIIMDRFVAEEFFKLVQEERVTVAAVVPAILEMILRDPNLGKYDLSSLRALNCSGAHMAPKLAEETEEKIGAVVFQRFGIQDIGSLTSTTVDDPKEARHRTLGRPHRGSEIRIVDEDGNDVPTGETGEIILRGALAVSGYFKDPERTWQTWDKNGWARSGDLGRFDEQGNLMIVGRIKDIIIRGGQNIDAAEVEAVLRTHPKVSEAAVVAMPDPVLGEKACAYVITKPGQQDLAFDEMLSFMRDKVAAFKMPERLEITKQMPLVAETKINKRALRQDIAEKLKAEGKLQS